ncbi:AroM family protein [Paenibacillus sp. MSJ-34]|uniref:AroM family protein n=1 Tax=Paenibacillus sp. MSJ-34 TaxID=2841529 RepID=UPI001C11DF93|nr:AroM family protein [Paenibacillus sp. MSJ-34]MBU5441193.1 AroM family protein [Paenibacillus sp. MSJ-34]
MKKLGAVTIGQAPRSDVGPILEKYIGEKAQIVQAGALDGMTAQDIARHFAPEGNDEFLTTKLLSGESVVLSGAKIEPLLQDKIDLLEETGCGIILVLCTGTFEGLHTRKAVLVEPDRVIRAAVSSIAANRTLGIIVPLLEQEDSLADHWRASGIAPVYAAASPYGSEESGFEAAADELVRQGAEMILLDCMGYIEDYKKIVERRSELPVILSNSLVAKVVSEFV